VFAPTSIWKRLTNEVSNNHRYFKIFSSSHSISGFERFIASIQLLTLQTVIVFLLTSFYNLQSSDDSSCQFIVNESNCLKQVTTFNKHQSYCKWEHEYNSCLYNADISISLYPILNIGLIVILLIPFINYILDLLFAVASRPLLEKKERKNLIVPVDETKIKNIKSKISSKTTMRKLTDIIHKSHANAELSYHYINYNFDCITIKRSELIDKILNVSRYNYPFICHHEDKNDDNSSINQDISAIDILCNNIYHQRSTLNQNEIEDFDLQWNSYFNGSNQRTNSYFFHDFFNNLITRKRHKSRIKKKITSQSYVINTLDNVTKQANNIIDKLNNSSQKEIGFEILYIFITDLLGRNTFESKIFQNKIENDFKNIKKVSQFHQRMSWVCIVLINVLFVYYSIQLGYYINSTFQMILLLCCFIHCFIEIFILEMIESIWVNFIIPTFAREDIRNINKLLNEVIETICDIEKKTMNYFLNSPSFFYVSTNIARKFPDLIESKLVRSYYYHLPIDENICINKQQNKLEIVNKQESRTILTRIIMKLVDKSIFFQRFFIRLFYSFIFISIIYVTNFMLYQETIKTSFTMLFWLYVVILLLILMLTFTIYKCYCFYSNESSIIKLNSKEKLDYEIRCDEVSDESVKPETVSPKSSSSSAKSSNVKESKDITASSKSTTVSLSSSVNTTNLLSPRTNIIQLKKESSPESESSSESDADSDESVNTANLLIPRTNIIQLKKESSSVSDEDSDEYSSSESDEDIYAYSLSESDEDIYAYPLSESDEDSDEFYYGIW
jgi:hypothetical protein